MNKNDLNRAQKALAENMVMAVRTRTATWTHHERSYFDTALGDACRRVEASLKLQRHGIYAAHEHYTAVIEKEIVDAIRIARTYHDMTAEEIIQTLGIVREALWQ